MRSFSFYMLALASLVSGCSILNLPTPSNEQALVRGYVTQCRSSVEIEDQDGNLSSYILRDSGTQNLIVRALSEPEQPEKYFGDDHYLCQDVTEHHLNFESKGGRTYRLHLDRTSPGLYSISVWEGEDRFAINTAPVVYHSEQKDLRRKCRFFYECDSLIRD